MQLDAASLRPVSFFQTRWGISSRLSYLDAEGISGNLAVVFKGGIRVLNPPDGVEAWRIDFGDSPEPCRILPMTPNGRKLSCRRVLWWTHSRVREHVRLRPRKIVRRLPFNRAGVIWEPRARARFAAGSDRQTILTE